MSRVNAAEVDAAVSPWDISNERLMNIDTSQLGSGATEVTTEAAVAFERSADGLEDVSQCFAVSSDCAAVVDEASERQYELGLAIGVLAKYGTVDVEKLISD